MVAGTDSQFTSGLNLRRYDTAVHLCQVTTFVGHQENVNLQATANGRIL
jgi:hypothetical protein